MGEEWNIDCCAVVQRWSNSGTEMTEGGTMMVEQ